MVCIRCGIETAGSHMCGGCAHNLAETSRYELGELLLGDELRELNEIILATAHIPRLIGSELTPDEIEYREDYYREDPVDGGGRRGWSNNFHNLFLALYDQMRQPSQPLRPGEHRLRTVESTGQCWQNFLNDDRELIEQINDVLERRPIIDRIRDLTFAVMRRNKWNEDSLKPIHDLFDPIVGIDCITMAFWKELDPLLRQAWKAMEVAGVDPRSIDA